MNIELEDVIETLKEIWITTITIKGEDILYLSQIKEYKPFIVRTDIKKGIIILDFN
jgi:hypothetical protein